MAKKNLELENSKYLFPLLGIFLMGIAILIIYMVIQTTLPRVY
jgi:hypothetical protein